jgi:tetratricopeptide (TPR) repeat protein
MRCCASLNRNRQAMTDLASAVADLLAGRISVAEARDRAAEPPGLDEADEWLSDVQNLITAVLSAKDPARAADLATVARPVIECFEHESQVGILLQIGSHLYDLENWSAALPFFSAVTARDDTNGDPGPYWFQFDILCRLDRDAEALELGPTLIAHTSEFPAAQVAVLEQQALLLRGAGRLSDAVEMLNDAVALRRTLPDGDADASPPVHELLLTLGDYARADGRLDAAISAFEQAREAALAAGAANRAAFALSELGYAYRNSGEAGRGTALLKTAAAEALQLGLIDDAIRWGAELSGSEAPGGKGKESAATALQRAANLVSSDPDKAVALARECVKAGVQVGDAFFETEARNIVGAGLNKLGRLHEALLAFRVALTAATRSGDLMAQFHVLGNLADLLFRMRNKTEFDQASAEAIGIGEQLMRTAGSGESRPVYDRMAEFSAVTYTPGGGSAAVAPDPARVLDVSQRMRGRNLLRWLSVRPYLDAADDAGRRAIIALRAAEVTVEAMAGEPGAVLGELLRQRADAEAALRARGLDGPTALLVGSEPIVFSPDQLAAALHPGELLVDVMSLIDFYLVNCVRSDGKTTTSAFNSSQPVRRAALVRLRAARMALLTADYQGGLPAAEAEYRMACAAMDEMLDDVAGQVAELGSSVKRIYVSPQMEFFAFPWWKLADRMGDVEICVLPVPGALPLLRARPPGSQPLARLLFIPDATGSLRNADADVAHVSHERCDGDALAILQALPRASALHFGGHARFDAANAYFSGFEVRQSAEPDPLSRPVPTKTPQPECALLTAAQLLARVDLPACDLAVLAACRTGIPRQHAANEFTSLPSAMLLDGARGVVASLWDTSDPAAALMMQDFYSGIAAGQVPPTALANARRTLPALDRSEIIARLGTDQYIPAANQPFARDIYTDPFQYYGTA